MSESKPDLSDALELLRALANYPWSRVAGMRDHMEAVRLVTRARWLVGAIDAPPQSAANDVVAK